MTGATGQPYPEDSRARLRDAAVAAFADRGFHGTTTREIAAAAGLSPAAMYMHHGSKEELLYLISLAGHEQTLQLVRAAAASAEDPGRQLAAVMRAYARHHAEYGTSARVVNYELAALSREHQSEIRALRRAIDTEMRQLVQRGIELGVFTATAPRIVANALLSLGIDLARWYRDDRDLTPEQIGEEYAVLALRMVGFGETSHDSASTDDAAAD